VVLRKGAGMKRKIWVAAAILGLFFSAPAWADVSWSTLRELSLDREPLDVAASADGESVFILLPGEVLVYSVQGSAVEKRIPVDKGFDRMTYAPRLHGLVLTGSGSKSLKILKLQDIHELDVSGLPFMGPENAPVTIAVFSDYQ